MSDHIDTTKQTASSVRYLRYRIEGEEAADFRITEYPCSIGRGDSCNIVIPDSSVSSLHAELTVDPDGMVHLDDKGSTNGIYYQLKRTSHVLVDKRLELIFGRVHVVIALTEAELKGDEPGVVAPPKPPQQTQAVPLPEPTTPTLVVPVAPPEPTVPKAPKTLSISGLPITAMENSPAATISRIAGSGRQGIVCPHCWHRFDVDEFLFIARHQSLIGDPVLGADAALRFLPSRFTPEGNAVDAAGMSCPDMACPRCHLRIPQAASEMPPLFLSIVGATASGKSYFLTSMTWELRNTLASNFAISFTDTDAVNNQILNDFEETVFLHSNADEIVSLRKTELQGELYNQVLLDNMLINLPKPFMFTVTPAEHHPRYEQVRDSMSRTLVLYDNAGEHFEPGMDSVDNPTTKHLIHSDTIFFLFDPTKDVRFRKMLTGSTDPQMAATACVQRQEIILTEMINRIKKYSGMRSVKKSAKTLLLVVSKFDVWKHLLDMDVPKEPWVWEPDYNTCVLDVDLIKNVSFAVRQLLLQHCPEVVATAESFAGEVLYMPNSALGHSPELNPETGMIGIRPSDVAPFWVTVPMLYFFYEREFIPPVPEQKRVRHEDTPVSCKLMGDAYFVTLPGRTMPLQIPVSFAGYQLRCPGTDMWFTVPPLERK